MKNRVYILNKGGHDHSDAERFGELIYVTEGTLDRYNTNQMYRQLVDAFRESSPHDYILVTSLSTLCCVAGAVFARKHGTLNLLLFKDGKYVERNHNLDALLTTAEDDDRGNK